MVWVLLVLALVSLVVAFFAARSGGHYWGGLIIFIPAVTVFLTSLFLLGVVAVLKVFS